MDRNPEKQFEGTELKAVAHYSYECLKEDVQRFPSRWRLRRLVAAIVREVNTQLAISDWASRNPSKVIPLAILARIQPLAATEDELLNEK